MPDHSDSTDTPRQIIGEWLRNSAIAVALIVGGFGVAEAIAKFLFGPRPGAGAAACYFIGFLPFIWFANRKGAGEKIAMSEFAVFAVVLTLTEAIVDQLQLAANEQHVIVCAVISIMLLFRNRWRSKNTAEIEPV